MRIVRIIKRLAKVPTVWWNLQRCNHSLKSNGYKVTATKSWSNNLECFTQAEIIQIHSIAGRLSPWTTCLRRSLLLKDDIQSIGKQAALVRGVMQGPNNKMLLHAWVEVEGKVVGDNVNYVSKYSKINDEI